MDTSKGKLNKDQNKRALSTIFFKGIAKKILRFNMWLIMLGVISLALASIITFLAGIAKLFLLLTKEIQWRHFHLPHNFDAVICALLEINLIGVILFICAIGLYLLFWKDIRVPAWLEISNVNQLKEKLVGIVITVMGVTFLEHILEWHDPQGTLMHGVAIALVIVALVIYLKIMASEGGEGGKDEHHSP